MKITVSGSTITTDEPGTLYRNRIAIDSGPGPFTVEEDGVYFVNEEPCIVVEKLELRRSELWEVFLDSKFREDIKPYLELRQAISQAKILFAKNDFYGADQKILLWK